MYFSFPQKAFSYGEELSFYFRDFISKLSIVNSFEECYPGFEYTNTWDDEKRDFLINIKLLNSDGSLDREADFYWCNGKLLPPEELENEDQYWTLLYYYPDELMDPSLLTEDDKEILRDNTTAESRKTGAGTPMFFFDFIYHSDTQRHLEWECTTTKFLGYWVTIHKRIWTPLKNVEKKIKDECETDAELKEFVDSLKTVESYYWRIIAGTSRKSFHSLGIALDFLPKRYGGKEVFWSWAKDHNPDNWMMTPLSRRWIPNNRFIEIFEEEGFVWGGKWAIWDNMHFEYHPELLMKAN